jgi:hypothetical protein
VAVFFTYAGRVTADTSIAVTPVAIEDAHRAIVEPINATREAGVAAEMYLADPYCSWQRGSNENFNGLLRRYFPKKTSFAGITEQQVQLVEQLINYRPRKRLDWKTPFEVINASASNYGVAVAA